MSKAKKSPGPRLIKSLTGLRDKLAKPAPVPKGCKRASVNHSGWYEFNKGRSVILYPWNIYEQSLIIVPDDGTFEIRRIK